MALFCLCVLAVLYARPVSSTEQDSTELLQAMAPNSSSPVEPNAPSFEGPTSAPSSASPSGPIAEPSPPSGSIPSSIPNSIGLSDCIGTSPLDGVFSCSSDGYWVIASNLTVGSGGLLTTMTVTGPTMVIGTLTVKEDGKLSILLPLDKLDFPRLDYAMLRATQCITIEGSIDVYATPKSIKAANETRLQDLEYFLFESPGCDVFPAADPGYLPFNDTLAIKDLPRCALVKARLDLINDSLPALSNITTFKGNATRRYIAAYVTWYHDCMRFYTKVLIPSIFGAMLAIILLVLVPMVFWTPKCCLDAKELEWRKKKKARREEERKAMLRKNRGSASMTSDEEFEDEYHGQNHTTDPDDIENGDATSDPVKMKKKEGKNKAEATVDSNGTQTAEKKKKKWTIKAILTAPTILLPKRHYHIQGDASKNKTAKKVKIASSSNAGIRGTSSPQVTQRRVRNEVREAKHDERSEVQMVAIPTVHSHESEFDEDSSDLEASAEAKSRQQAQEDYENDEEIRYQ